MNIARTLQLLLATPALLMAAIAFANDPFVPGIAEGPTPWTHDEFLNRSGDFRFLIMSDRTGGERPGIFNEAIDKVNLLQPEFVVSIGDLIDGYTTDAGRAGQQWHEFEAMIARLEMPFFRLAGNHDISNPFLHDEWVRRYGQPYYHFLYRDVLFLCLNTEDPPPGGIGEAQAEYFRAVLEQHGDTARWIFVFMHRPFWDYGNQQGYERIATLLDGRRFTLFSGHHHYYYKTEIDGNIHMVLGTTGGGSLLRGEALGEFDHVTWVTMRDDGPRITHLKLDGILDTDLVTGQNRDIVQALRDGSWMSVRPTLLDSASVDRIPVTLTLSNPSPLPMRLTGSIPPQAGLVPSIGTIDRILPPGSSEDLVIDFTAENGVLELPLKDFLHVSLTASVQQNGRNLSAPATHRHLLDWVRPLPVLPIEVTLNSPPPDEWYNDLWIDVERPNFIREDWDWRGPRDGTFRFAVAKGTNMLWFVLHCADDRVQAADGSDDTPQDRFLITIGGSEGSVELEAAWLASRVRHRGEPLDEAFYVAGPRSEGGALGVFLPLDWLRDHIGEDLDEIRLNVAWTDVDDPLNVKPSVLWWQPPWDSPAHFEGSGTFRVDEKASAP